MDHLTIALTPAGLIAGKLVTIREGKPGDPQYFPGGEIVAFDLHKPRAILTQSGGGQMQVGFSECIGSPDVLHLSPDVAYYEVKDARLFNAYIQATTGIQIANAIPTGVKP